MLSIFLNNIFKKSLFFQLKRSFSVEFLNWLFTIKPKWKSNNEQCLRKWENYSSFCIDTHICCV